MEFGAIGHDPESNGQDVADIAASGEYAEEYNDGYIMPENEFNLINSVVCDGIQKEREMGATTLSFDLHEELLWVGTKSGHVTSYYGPELQKYTSFQVHPTQEVRNIMTLEHGILALTNTTLRSQMRRGIPCFTHTSENMVEMYSMSHNPRNNRVLLGGMQEKLIELDLTTAKEVRYEMLDPGGSCAILRDHGRFTCCGDAINGKVHLRDPRTLKVAHTLDAHSGTLCDFDVQGNHLVTCGQSIRQAAQVVQPDRFLMVYDLRILRAISPIQTSIVPYQLRFLPSMSSRIAVLCGTGQVQIVDMAALSTPHYSLFHISVPMEGGMVTSMDISPSNQCLAFGDTTNSLHLFSSVQDPVLNPYPRETEFADPVPHHAPMDIEDEMAIYSSIPRPYLGPGQNSYASDYWPERLARQTHRPTPEIDPEILRSMKVVGTIGYARNISNLKRNQVRYANVRTRDSRDKDGMGSKDSDGAPNVGVPSQYRKIAIKFTKMGADEFDFDRYNRTGFCGLEASLPNSYSNSMLQILYYTEKLRILLLNHTCNKENCICCELSFLFHMMDISSGIPCQSGNFLRSLRTIPEASALGLVFTDQISVWTKTNVPRLIQSWNRFILQQMQSSFAAPTNEELSSGAGSKRGGGQASPMKGASKAGPDDGSNSIFNEMFGMKHDKVNVCTKCKRTVSTRDTVLLVNLLYPDKTEVTSFEEVVCSSMCPEQTTPAWCDKCHKYQATNQSRNLHSLPHVLSMNAGMDNPQDISFWQTQMEHVQRESQPDPAVPQGDAAGKTSSAATATNAKSCRYAQACNRPDCRFWHPDSESVPKEDLDIGDKLLKLKKSWVPMEIKINRHANGKVSNGEVELLEDSPVVETKRYLLYAVCYAINDSNTGQAHNIGAAINVSPYYHARVASPVSQWYLFNDFSINTILPEEATWFNLKWKIPSLFLYQCVDEPVSIQELSFRNPISAEVFGDDKSLAQKGGRKRITFSPLSVEEMPQKGDLVAIDAEFVTLNQEESELRSDGKVSTIKAAQMSVARITCVRGQGTNEGEPFIDDYISTQEQVVDYVTKFSGIHPGDLDANFSSKHLTTLKSTYKKLRYLVDTGCIFIGHGLKNDFKVINLVVPVEQVIDTVHLFHMPHNRMVSLKFLAWHFLGKKIQGVTHDSIEDAVTALALYRKHVKLKRDEKIVEALNTLYDKGKELNWKVPED